MGLELPHCCPSPGRDCSWNGLSRSCPSFILSRLLLITDPAVLGKAARGVKELAVPSGRAGGAGLLPNIWEQEQGWLIPVDLGG